MEVVSTTTAESTRNKLLQACLVTFVIIGAVSFIATLFTLAVICGLATAAAIGTGDVGLATIPGAAMIVLAMGGIVFVILPFYCLLGSRSINKETGPAFEDRLSRGTMAVFGACVGSLIGAIVGVIVAFGALGWPGGLLVLGVSVVIFSTIGYLSPNFGGEFLAAVFEKICDFVLAVGRFFE